MLKNGFGLRKKTKSNKNSNEGLDVNDNMDDDRIVLDSFEKKRVKITFTSSEIKDIILSWLAISFAFSIAFSLNEPFILSKFVYLFIVSLLTAGIGFVGHELAHKYVAIRNNFEAIFVASYSNLVGMIIISFLGIIFAAPGAVVIRSKSRYLYSEKKLIEKSGEISLAGPLTNAVIALIFILLYIFIKSPIITYGAIINSSLAIFNMIPILNFDGLKVLLWNKGYYFYSLIGFVAIAVISYLI